MPLYTSILLMMVEEYQHPDKEVFRFLIFKIVIHIFNSFIVFDVGFSA